jgi:lysophospholipase L1-like esterase
MEKKKSKLKYVIFSIVPLLVLLLAVELLLRIVYFQRNNKETFAITALIHKIKNRNVMAEIPSRYIRLKEHAANQNRSVKPWPEYLKNTDNLEVVSYQFRTDENGFILPANNHQNPDLKIVFLGGSTTECSFVNESLRFPYLVGLQLQKSTNLKINTYNSGVSGNHTYHAIDILLNKIIPMKPQYAVLMENINDWTTLLFEGTYFNQNLTRSLIINPNIQIHNLNLDEWSHLRGKKLQLNDTLILKEFKKAQLTFISICKANGIIPILMTQANRYKENPEAKIVQITNNNMQPFGLDYNQVLQLHKAMNNVIRTNAFENNLMLIDLEKEVPQTNEFLYDVVHFNNKGSQLAASIISNQIQTIIK